jgi:hypothetical protein
MADPAPATSSTLSDRADRALILAWIVSVAVHVVLFTVMVAVPWIVEKAGPPTAPMVAKSALEDLPRTPKFRMTTTQNPVAAVREAVQADPRVQPRQQGALQSLSEITQPELSIVGIGAGGGEFAKYGLQVGAGDRGPQFFGIGGEARAARRIIYVVDRSGSMIEIFSECQKELKRSINELRKSQKYHVIFYSTDPPLEAPPGRLVNAIRASKDATFAFIDSVQPEGSTQPIEAMRVAFAHNPDLIFFLSDGEIPEAEELKIRLREWNPRKTVRIFTIAYVNQAGRQLLEDIAREHGGAFRFVSEHEIAP